MKNYYFVLLLAISPCLSPLMGYLNRTFVGNCPSRTFEYWVVVRLSCLHLLNKAAIPRFSMRISIRIAYAYAEDFNADTLFLVSVYVQRIFLL